LDKTFDIVVTGAGIFGTSIAYQLKRLGVPKVLLIERAAGPGVGTTQASAAIVRQHYSNAILSRLTGETVEILQELEASARKPQLYTQAGWYFLIPPQLLDGAVQNIAMQKQAGVITELIPASKLPGRMPWLNPEGVAAVAYEPNSGYADPVNCCEALATAFQDLGGEVAYETRSEALIRKGRRVTGVRTDKGVVNAAITVNACGPWSKALAASAQIELPLTIYREQETLWHCRRAAEMPPSSISNGVDAIYLRPLGGGRYTIGRGFPKDYIEADPNAFDRKADDDYVNDVLTRLKLRFLPFSNAQYLDGFASLYDVTPDWYPFVGPRDDVDGYVDACGGSGHGFKLAPAMGRRLARWLVGREVSADFAQLSYNRVIANQLFVQKFGGNRG
jgi:sarcosine oxidase, subunit beta